MSKNNFFSNPLFKLIVGNRSTLFGLIVITVVVFFALTAPIFYPNGPLKMVASPLIWPFTQASYPLGTDAIGRNIAAIMAYGARTTLVIGLVASLIATIIGIIVGAISGYYHSWISAALMRITDIFQTIPNLIFLLAIVAALGPHTWYIMVGMGISSWTSIARLTHVQFLTLTQREYIDASRVIGEKNWSIIVRDIIPNALPPIVVMSTLLVSAAVLFEAALAFLGFTDPDVASWGRLLGDGRPLLRNAWYVAAIPGFSIFITVLALNLLGDGINDALNPKLIKRKEAL